MISQIKNILIVSSDSVQTYCNNWYVFNYSSNYCKKKFLTKWIWRLKIAPSSLFTKFALLSQDSKWHIAESILLPPTCHNFNSWTWWHCMVEFLGSAISSKSLFLKPFLLNQPFSQGIPAQTLIKNQLFNLYALIDIDLNCNLKSLSKLVACA